MTYPDNSVVNYEYDLLNRMTGVTDNESKKTEYTYDAASRLISTAYPNGWKEENEYDAAGQLIKTWDIDPSNKTNKTIRASCEYDSQGNLISYDRCGTVTLFESSTVQKKYVLDYTSALKNVIVEKETNGLDYRYVYGLEKVSVRISPVENGAGGITVNGAIKLYYHHDRLGSTDFLTDDVKGKVTSYVDYNEWGEPVKKAILKLGIRELDLVTEYTGHPYDSVLGIYYARARMYDAADKRFMAMDTLKDGSACYIYVSNNPFTYLDLWGLEKVRVEVNNGDAIEFDTSNTNDVLMFCKMIDPNASLTPFNYSVKTYNYVTKENAKIRLEKDLSFTSLLAGMGIPEYSPGVSPTNCFSKLSCGTYTVYAQDKRLSLIGSGFRTMDSWLADIKYKQERCDLEFSIYEQWFLDTLKRYQGLNEADRLYYLTVCAQNVKYSDEMGRVLLQSSVDMLKLAGYDDYSALAPVMYMNNIILENENSFETFRIDAIKKGMEWAANVRTIIVITSFNTINDMNQTISAKDLGVTKGAGNGLVKDGLGQVSGKSYNVTQSDINAITKHLSGELSAPENTAMINRLQNALNSGQSITGADASFYLHELKEIQLIQGGMTQTAAHQAALNHYGVSPFSTYHPDVIKAMPETFNSSWFNFWGIGK